MPSPRSAVLLPIVAGTLLLALAGCAPTSSSHNSAVGAKSGTSNSTSSASGSGNKVSYYNAHPCDLVSETQTQSIVGYTLKGETSTPASGTGKCTFNSVAPVAKPVGFGLDNTTTVSTMQQAFPKVTAETVGGHAGFCSAGSTGIDANLYLTVSQSAGVFYATVDSCSDAIAMAKIAFANLG